MPSTLIISIMVEPREPRKEESTVGFLFVGTGYSSPKSASPWSPDQRAAVRRAVAGYLGLPPGMNEAEREQRIDAAFGDVNVFEFHLGVSGWASDEEFDETSAKASRLYESLRTECEQEGMVVHMIHTI